MSKLSLVAIVGLGANDLEIPLVICGNEAAAHKYLTELGLKIRDGGSYDLYSALASDKAYLENNDKGSPATRQILAALFHDSYYYSGCGDCHALRIKPVELNTPMVHWDLD